MTKFDITKFDMGHGSERWVMYDRKFVARFKYRGAAAARDFVKFLVKNFTVEEYFGLLETKNPNSLVNNNYSPAEILESKGHINYNIRMQMKARGIATKAEYMAIIRQEYDAYRVRTAA